MHVYTPQLSRQLMFVFVYIYIYIYACMYILRTGSMQHFLPFCLCCASRAMYIATPINSDPLSIHALNSYYSGDLVSDLKQF